MRPGAILEPRAGLVAAWLSQPGPRRPSAPRPGAQPRREAAVRRPTSAAPLPRRDNPLPEAPQRRVRRPAAAPEEDVVGGVQREEAVHGDENRAETLPRQPHPTRASAQAATNMEMGQGLGCGPAPRSCRQRVQAQALREGVTRNGPAHCSSAPPRPRPTSVACRPRPAIGSAPAGSAGILPALDPGIGLWNISPSLVLLLDLCRVNKALFNPAHLPMY